MWLHHLGQQVMHPEDTPSRPFARLLRIVWFVVLAITAMTMLGFVAQYWWFLDYFLLFALVVFSLTRKIGKVALVVLALLINGATLIPYYRATEPPSRATRKLRLVSANVGARKIGAPIAINHNRLGAVFFCAFNASHKSLAHITAQSIDRWVLSFEHGNIAMQFICDGI